MTAGNESTLLRLARLLALALLVLAVTLSGLWGTLALFHRFPGGTAAEWSAAIAWGLFSMGTLVLAFRRQAVGPCLIYAAAFALLLYWWMSILPRNDRGWADEVARTSVGLINGSAVTLGNLRNFNWRTATDYDVNWETRTYDLDSLSAVDLILSYWSGPAIAHTLVSFGFLDGRYVTFSVEIRKERHEAFSELGGFFKQFEMSVVAADERDIVRLRTNIRKEDVHLYRLRMEKPAMRSLFLAYVDEANTLSTAPKFYNTLTANCTTIVYSMVDRIVSGLPADYRLFLSGYLPEYVGEVGGLAPGFSVDELRKAGAISKRARDADNDPDFSRLIRADIPGIDR